MRSWLIWWRVTLVYSHGIGLRQSLTLDIHKPATGIQPPTWLGTVCCVLFLHKPFVFRFSLFVKTWLVVLYRVSHPLCILKPDTFLLKWRGSLTVKRVATWLANTNPDSQWERAYFNESTELQRLDLNSKWVNDLFFCNFQPGELKFKINRPSILDPSPAGRFRGTLHLARL